MVWEQLELTPPHITFLILPLFLIAYCLFSKLIRNSLHLSEPPLAVIFGIIFGPVALNVLRPREWGINDEILQEITRVIVAIQCFAVGIELPKHYFYRHWSSVLYFLGPIMTFSCGITALFAYFIFKTTFASALIIGACLSPTDPVLAASVLSNSRFSSRVPKRLRNMLSAESASNDGVSFPFLYAGIYALKFATPKEALKEWVLITVLWQCVFGISIGLIIGNIANRILRFTTSKKYVSESSFVVFYLLLALLSVGVGSTLGSDDFLVAFGAGVGFGHDGWFTKKQREVPFPTIVEMVLNSTMFILFGSIIPWSQFSPRAVTPHVGIWQLSLFLILVLLFRRIPIVLAMKRFIPDVRTYREALFCGHIGPMGVGALFLAMEARGQLEGDGTPKSLPKFPSPPFDDKTKAIYIVWPVVCFVVLGSTMVHGLSVLVISLSGHLIRDVEERAPLLGAETDGLDAMDHSEGNGSSEPEVSGTEDEIE